MGSFMLPLMLLSQAVGGTAVNSPTVTLLLLGLGHQVMAAARQSVRVYGASAGGCVGDERGVGTGHRRPPPVGVTRLMTIAMIDFNGDRH